MGIFVLINNYRSKLNQLFFYFCLGTAIWMIPNSFINSGIFDLKISLFLAKIVFSSVVFLPTIALHFTIEFLKGYAKERARFDLKIAYALTTVFFLLLWTTPYFIIGLNSYSWGYYPKGGFIHIAHSIFVIATAIYVVATLWTGMRVIESREGKSKKYYETMLVFIAFLSATLSCVDFIQSWGYAFFPVGSICITFFVTSITYGIFKHNLLGVSIVFKKSLVYSLLISSISVLYFLCVYITSLFVGNITEINSFPFILVVLTLITFLFKPIENRIRTSIDALFFRKPRDVIEKENERLMEEMLKQDRLRSVATLAAGMAHEIKNPLTSIKTFAEYLPSKYHDPDFRDKFSRIVVDEVDRVNNIVKQLLEFSKPALPALKPILIGSLLDETLGLIQSNIIRREIEVTKELDMFAIVQADRNQLKQAFLNLYLNAIQSMSDGGKLHLAAHSEHNGLTRISIMDSGCGMVPDQVKHAFDPFFTTKEDGTGLGLAIVHSIITKHGGKIEIKSKAGVGTTVNVFLKSLD